MKKTITLIMAVMLSGMTAFAQLAEGFYRVQNYGSKRYMYIRDNTGVAGVSGTDMGALEMWSGFEKTLYDASSIIYVKKVDGAYDLTSQGTGVHELTGYNMTITKAGDYYMVYSSGQYLYEVGTSDFYDDLGILGAKTNKEMPGKSSYRVWNVIAVNSSTDNYFGFKPTITAKGKYYAPFYGDFAYTPINQNLKTWYVSKIDAENGIAIISQVTGTVARSQAVIVECVSADTKDNKVDLTTATGNAAKGNLLTGTYFDNADRSGVNHKGKEPAIIPFDASTMRVLTVDANGNLVFVNDSKTLPSYDYVVINGKEKMGVKCIPHNQSYLTVDAKCPATLKVMNEQEYENFLKNLVKPVGTANIALDIQVAVPVAESGKDIPATGGKDRVLAKVTYKNVLRTFMSNGTYTDAEAGRMEQTLYSAYTNEQPNLGTTQRTRTKIASLTAEGVLMDATGKVIKCDTKTMDGLKDCKVSAQALDIYQEANEVSYGDVKLTLKNTEIEVTADAQEIDLNTLVQAEQTLTYTSLQTRSGKVEISYAVKTPVNGFSLKDHVVEVTKNSINAKRNSFVVSVTAEGEGNKIQNAEITFSQAISAAVSGVGTAEHEGTVYDLQGRVANPNQKGIRVVNGKLRIKK